MSGPQEVTSFNKSSFSNETGNCDPVNNWSHIFFTPVLSLVFLVGLVFNSFTMTFYFCQAQQRPSSSLTVYLKNLMAADFLLCLSLPIRIANYASSSATIHLLYCSFGASALFLNMYASILFMGYIAANRYLKIVHPLETHILQTVRAAHIISGVTWVSFLIPAIVYIILFFMAQNMTSESIHCDSQVSLLDKIIHLSATTIFLLVLVFLVFFYYSTSRRVLLAQQKEIAASSSRKLVKSRRNILVLVSVFCVCFVPYHLSRILYMLQVNCSVVQMLYYLKEVTTVVSVLNICLDPLVYFFLSKAFRAQVKKTMLSRKKRVDTQQVQG
ncbi:P2Y purinoceptor 14-like [Archocentrus centrarchus]|uniref:P2Y purinoceptor 14-like n=1 Tax=Archocentrus centrarchus TaxID=63155 RepID=UPI0011EA36FA|nr:P2Y purinoceptor 14-like [Archocentrus centrarchus]